MHKYCIVYYLNTNIHGIYILYIGHVPGTKRSNVHSAGVAVEAASEATDRRYRYSSELDAEVVSIAPPPVNDSSARKHTVDAPEEATCAIAVRNRSRQRWPIMRSDLPL